MRLHIRLIVACWLVLGGLVRPAAGVTLFQGRPYHAVGGWAAAGGFKWAWTKPNEELVVTNRWARMRFAVDSRRAEFNGVAVWLSEPVARRNGEPFLASIDLNTLLGPLLKVPKLPANRKIRTVCLDPGHGGRDPGNQERGQQEKKFALLLAREVKQILQAAGLKVVLTRSTDVFLDLPERPRAAARLGADMFVSLHFNAAADRRAGRGAEVYCLTPPGASSTNAGGEGSNAKPTAGNDSNDVNLTLAYQIQHALVQGLGLEDRGVRRARFAVLRPIRVPSVLVEAAFMTNEGDLKRITDPVRRKQLAQGIADGILASKRLLERATPRTSAR